MTPSFIFVLSDGTSDIRHLSHANPTLLFCVYLRLLSDVQRATARAGPPAIRYSGPTDGIPTRPSGRLRGGAAPDAGWEVRRSNIEAPESAGSI